MVGPLLRFPRKMALLWRVSRGCGQHAVDKWRLWLRGIALYLCDPLPIHPVFNVAIHVDGRRMKMRLGSLGDYSTLHEVFIERVYEVPNGYTPKSVVDLGSNIGLATAFFILRYPEAQIWGFEPDPRNWQRLLENIGSLEGVKTYNVAAAKADGSANFSIDAHRGTSSGLNADGSANAICVETWTLDRVLDETGCRGVDLVKFDIEGAEYEVFETFKGWERVHIFAGEIHRGVQEGQSEELCALFSSKGFDVQKAEDTATGVLHIIARRH